MERLGQLLDLVADEKSQAAAPGIGLHLEEGVLEAFWSGKEEEGLFLTWII